jgi:molecular chaperone GrpE
MEEKEITENGHDKHAAEHQNDVQNEKQTAASVEETDKSAVNYAENTADNHSSVVNDSEEGASYGKQRKNEEPGAGNEPENELTIMKKKNDELNDKYLRLYSEFENYRKRTSRERLELIQSAGAEVIKNLLSVLDDFERAAKANETCQDLAIVKEGFALIHNRMLSILLSKGLKEMEAIGTVFDVEQHEALTNIPAPTEDLKGKVVEVVEKGYVLNGQVIRYAKVIVGQ